MSPTRIQALFDDSRLNGHRRKALIAYITAGDPSPERTPALIAALERGGVDLIELGVPFSDPIADGPVIQRGADRALKAGTTVAKVLEIAKRVRETSQIPLLLFTYLNPVLRYGLAALPLRRRNRYAHDEQQQAGRELYVAAMRSAGLGCGSDVHAEAAQARFGILHGLRLSCLAYRSDRRAVRAFPIFGASGDRDACLHETAARRWIRHLDG